MKRTLLLAASAALLLSSCAKEEKTATNQMQVSFVIDGPVTRVNTVENVTSFEEGDKIAITSNGLLNDITSELYTLEADGLAGKEVSFCGEGTATFVAHYPTSATYTDNHLCYTVPTVQTAENFHESMFMVAEAEGSAAVPTVNLKFKHKLAWVKVALTNIAGTEVSLCNVAPTAEWTKNALTATGNTVEVTAWKQADAQTYWVLIPAQTIEAGKRFISLTTTEGKTYEYTLTEALTINTAKVKTITLSLSEEGGEVTVNANFSVDSTEDATWEDDDLTLDGNVTEVEEPAFALISAEQGNFANVTLNTNQTGKDKLAAGWGTVIATSTVKNDDETETKVPNAVIAIEEDAATITGSGYGAWYNKTLGYLATDARPGTYEISLTYKVAEVSGTADNNDLQIMLMQAGTSANVYYKINGLNNAYPVCTAEYSTKTFTAVIPEEATLDNGVLFMITPKAASIQKFYIKNVSIIEVK